MILYTNQPISTILNLAPPKSIEMKIDGAIINAVKTSCGKNRIQRVISTDLATYLDKNIAPGMII